jgi:hypothetical protein
VSGTNFDATTCSNNVVSIGTVTAPATGCTSTTLAFVVPQSVPYGSQQQISVSTSGLPSNLMPLIIARQTGNFVEITNSIKGNLAGGTCSTGAVQLTICGPGCPSYLGTDIATFQRTGGAQIGQPLYFNLSNSRVSGIAGAGFNSVCSIGAVFQGDVYPASSTSPLLGITLLDLAGGHTFPPSGMYMFHYDTPSATASYAPRIFQSPDGTLLIVVTASFLGSGELTAAVFDVMHPTNNPSTSCQSQQVNSTFSATVTSANQIIASLAGTACSTIPIQ